MAVTTKGDTCSFQFLLYLFGRKGDSLARVDRHGRSNSSAHRPVQTSKFAYAQTDVWLLRRQGHLRAFWTSRFPARSKVRIDRPAMTAACPDELGDVRRRDLISRTLLLQPVEFRHIGSQRAHIAGHIASYIGGAQRQTGSRGGDVRGPWRPRLLSPGRQRGGPGWYLDRRAGRPYLNSERPGRVGAG
jgi:hypothetical protein